jgi:CBS domain-containing protein
MKVKSLLKKKGSRLLTVTPDIALVDAVRTMMENRVGSLLVAQDGRLISIITERDVMAAVDRSADRLRELTVGDMMAKQLVTCNSDDGVDAIMDLMLRNPTKHRIRHLPVVDNGELLGVVSIGDVVDALLTEAKFENQLLKNYIKNWPEPAET